MIQVSNAAKSAWLSEKSEKHIKIVFPDLALTLDDENIIEKSLNYSSYFMTGKTVEFIGCIASQFSISLADVKTVLNGQKIKVYVKADNTDEIPLFTGYVTSVTNNSNGYSKKLVCNDALYKLNKVDVTEWYYAKPRTHLQQLLEDLLDYVGISIGSINLGAVANLVCYMGENTEWLPQNISALDLMKSICQLAGVYGKINRAGEFDTNIAHNTTGTAYVIPDYESCSELDYYVHAPDGVIVTNNDSLIVTGEQYGPDKEGICQNPYIIKNNVLSNPWTGVTGQKRTLVENLFGIVSDINFRPFELKRPALPFLEPGDLLNVTKTDLVDGAWQTVNRTYLVLKHTIKDWTASFSASGSEYFNENGTSSTHVGGGGSAGGGDVITIINDPLYYLTYKNDYESIVIDDGETEKIIDMTASFRRETHVVFDIQIECDVVTTETDSNDVYTENEASVRLYYVFDGVAVNDDSPKATLTDGKHIIKVRHDEPNVDASTKNFQVYLQTSGGKINLVQNSVKCVIEAGGMKDDAWGDPSIYGLVTAEHNWVKDTKVYGSSEASLSGIVEV